LETVKYRQDIDQFFGWMVYKTQNLESGEFVVKVLEERVDEEWVWHADSPEMVENIINLDSGDGYVAVPQRNGGTTLSIWTVEMVMLLSHKPRN
jgi:hypothetical protein